jgi:NAD(P)-dependent dehydrogenase (short-subunit alcohol dehydrogenase family)
MANDAQVSGLAGGGVVITGASSGIGKECALYLDQRGYRVFAGVRKASDGDVLSKVASSRLSPVIVDVTDSSAVSDAARQVEQALGEVPLIGLVNNAGIGTGGPVEFLEPSELRRQMEVNLVGPLVVIQAFMPLLRRSRGRIVNISSIGGKVSAPFRGPYSASKFALEALSDALRAEVKPWGIDVSIVEPGSIKSDIWKKSHIEVDEILRALLPDGVRYYGQEIEAFHNVIANSERAAVPAERVAKVVEHALTARRPRTRYLVGFDAKLMALLHWILPDRAFDGLLARFMRSAGGDASSRDAKSGASQDRESGPTR